MATAARSKIELPPRVAGQVAKFEKRIRDAIKRRRQDLGITQRELGEKMGGRAQGHIAQIETGGRDEFGNYKKALPLEVIVWAADALDTTVEALITGAYSKPSKDPIHWGKGKVAK